MKKILSLALSFIIVLTTLMPVSSVAYAQETERILKGQNCEMNLDTGVLVIKNCNYFYTAFDFKYEFEKYEKIPEYNYKYNEYTDKINTIIIGNGITIIQPYCFNEFPNIKEVYIPKTLKRIPNCAFGCCSVEKVNYGGSQADWNRILINKGNDCLEAADKNYFCDIPSFDMTEEQINYSLNKKTDETYISVKGDGRFYYYKGLLELSGKGEIRYGIGFGHDISAYLSFSDYEFNNGMNYVTDISVGNGIELLSNLLFRGSPVERLTLPKSLKTIEKECFKDCNSLTDIYYYGTAKDWNKIKIASGNEALANAEIHYIPAPGAIKNLSASSTSNSITLSWGKSSNAKEYIVDKYIANKKQWVRVGKTTETSLKLPAIAGCKYRYRVYAYRDVNYGKKLFSGYTYLEAVAKPKGTTVKSLAAGKKKITVKWNKQATRTTGYQIEYSTNSSFKNSTKIKVSNPNSTSKAITGLKSGKKYYVRVRTYKTATVNGKKATTYSYWTSAKSTKCK